MKNMEVELILVPTNEEPIEGDLLLRHIWKNDPKLESNNLYQYKDTKFYSSIEKHDTKVYRTLNGSFEDYYTSFIVCRLHAVVIDEIKTGDLFYNTELGQIIEATGSKYPNEMNKVVASMDSLLNCMQVDKEWVTDEGIRKGKLKNGLPKFPQQFLLDFINHYNKGKIFKKALVEFDIVEDTSKDYIVGKGQPCIKLLKVNPINNTVEAKLLDHANNL